MAHNFLERAGKDAGRIHLWLCRTYCSARTKQYLRARVAFAGTCRSGNRRQSESLATVAARELIRELIMAHRSSRKRRLICTDPAMSAVRIHAICGPCSLKSVPPYGAIRVIRNSSTTAPRCSRSRLCTNRTTSCASGPAFPCPRHRGQRR